MKTTDYSIVKCNYMTESGEVVKWTTNSLEDGMLTYRKALKKRERADRPSANSFKYEFGTKGKHEHALPDTDPRHKEYCQLQKDCFGFYAHNAGPSMDRLANELLNEGWTHLANPFGSIEIKNDHAGFVGRQSIAKSMATDGKVRA